MRKREWNTIRILNGLFFISLLSACSQPEKKESDDPVVEVKMEEEKIELVLEAESYLKSSPSQVRKDYHVMVLDSGQWLSYELEVPVSGRYRTVAIASSTDKNATMWIEDYVENTDGRTYNITGDIIIPAGAEVKSFSVDGTPLAQGVHPIRIHSKVDGLRIDKIRFDLMKVHKASPTTLTQSMDGEEWSLVWSDEFEGEEVDQSKWTYDIGDWGWGNNELQYYTDNKKENARLEDGALIIEAHKNKTGDKWTSARLTTRGKVDFLYGKIEFKAKAPAGRGSWAAAWTLGDSYVDELSWPYCGEIDILESVGYETDTVTNTGIAHATVHTPAYYFKINNQISSTRPVENITSEWHTYSVVWTPTEIRGYVDGEEYYLYDKIANEKEWPFNQPQNIILNLAMGGGWGGAMGMDKRLSSQEFFIDYVRVYERN
jgi:beta-glucanase (GH16 family)